MGEVSGIIVVVGGPGVELDCSNEVDARIVEEAHKFVTLSAAAAPLGSADTTVKLVWIESALMFDPLGVSSGLLAGDPREIIHKLPEVLAHENAPDLFQ